jgi:hypothetical protein
MIGTIGIIAFVAFVCWAFYHIAKGEPTHPLDNALRRVQSNIA